MNRRGFLGFFGGAVAAGPAAARSMASESVLKQTGFAGGSEVAGAAPAPIENATSSAYRKAVRWIRRNGIPEWKMNELRQRAEHKRGTGIDPDLAVLRSVSPGWKAREQRRRNLEREIEFSLSSIGRGRARDEFSKKLSDRFGGWMDWYD